MGLDIRQFPIKLHPRGGGAPKLSPLRDGWRNLRLMLLHSPTFLFVLPGFATVLLGAITMFAVFANGSLFGHTFQTHTLIGGSLLVVVGTQLLGFGLCGRTYAVNHLGHPDPWLERNGARFRLEHGLLLGGGLTAAGMSIGSIVVGEWLASGLGSLSEESALILAATLVIVGVQVFFTSFLLSILSIRRPERP
jgi:hypothetical protein